jgi:hypothetical protein
MYLYEKEKHYCAVNVYNETATKKLQILNKLN